MKRISPAILLLLAAALILLACGGGIPPKTPEDFTVTAVSSSQIDLNWAESKMGNNEFKEYRIYRNSSHLAAVTETSYSDTDVVASTTYCYYVVTYDMADNESSRTDKLCATTPADSTAPDAPTGLAATAISESQVDLSWTAPSDTDLAGYNVYRDSALIASVTSESFSDGGLSKGTEYCYHVSAFDNNGNESAKSNEACAVTLGDGEAPSVPTSLSTLASSYQVDLLWSASTDNVAVAGYKVYRDSSYVGMTTSESYSDSGLGIGSEYCYAVSAYDATGNESAPSTQSCATTHDADAPAPPSGLVATKISDTQIDLYWNSSTDDVGVTGYNIYLVNAPLGTSTTPYYSDFSVTAGNTYCYKVSAYDAAGNESAKGERGCATTVAWAISTIDSTDDVGEYTSLALDSSGSVHISYFDFLNSALKYATNSGGAGFTNTTVDSDGGYYTSIAVDASDSAHISHLNLGAGDLMYTTNAGGSFANTVVDSGTGSVGWDTSIALDSSEYVHISYYDASNKQLKYATNFGGGGFTNTVVEATTGSEDVGEYSSIALDTGGIVHISYYDFYNKDLKYATNASGWASEAVDSGGDVGINTSIVIRQSDNSVHISYYDITNGNLKYATNASGFWVSVNVDSNGDVGRYSCIALDSGGKVHISYYDATNGDLKYATNSSGSWAPVTIDSDGDVGRHTSLAINQSNGSVHISYYDATNGDLKYATY